MWLLNFKRGTTEPFTKNCLGSVQTCHPKLGTQMAFSTLKVFKNDHSSRPAGQIKGKFLTSEIRHPLYAEDLPRTI